MNLDLTSILFFQSHANPVFDILSFFFSLFFTFWLSGAFFALFYLIKREKRFFPIIIGIIDTSIIVALIKIIVKRARPGLDIIPTFISSGIGYSYPSGHTGIAFVIAVILSRSFPKYSKWFYGTAILAGLSRIYLGVHYPTDVIAGAMVGIIIGIITINLEKPIKLFEQKINKCTKSLFK